jgi:hypothetical protein
MSRARLWFATIRTVLECVQRVHIDFVLDRACVDSRTAAVTARKSVVYGRSFSRFFVTVLNWADLRPEYR